MMNTIASGGMYRTPFFVCGSVAVSYTHLDVYKRQQPDDGWLDVYIIRKVSRVTIAKLLGMYKSGKHFQNGQLVRAAEPYFIYRRAKQVSLRAADGRGPIVATADGECAPKEQITVQVQPLAGRILLPKPAFERFAAQRTAQSADRT